MSFLRIRGLGKAYRRYSRKWGRLAEWMGARPRHELKWVLRDVTFDIAPGESVGIIGTNGAGKSTLLKIVAGTTRPTTGSVEVGGAVSALLELGIGFHPDFTGRENVYMAGSIRGLPPQLIEEKMGDIEAFAEIGASIDEPVRTYSSGMHVRLAFSVATALRPDILIVDEALSVGDAYFQHKSFDRIRRFREEGSTLLFVSHDPGAIKSLCDRAILLDQGQAVRDGPPDAVLDYYNAMIAVQEASSSIRQVEREEGRVSTRSGNEWARIDDVELLSRGLPTRAVRAGDPLSIRVSLTAVRNLDELTVGVLLKDRLGNDVFGTNTYHCGNSLRGVREAERACVEFTIDEIALGVGTFSVTVAAHTGVSHVSSNYDWWDRALVFQVVRGDGPFSVGLCKLPVRAAWLGPGQPEGPAP